MKPRRKSDPLPDIRISSTGHKVERVADTCQTVTNMKIKFY